MTSAHIYYARGLRDVALGNIQRNHSKTYIFHAKLMKFLRAKYGMLFKIFLAEQGTRKN
jgi:hypothetical protein